MCMLGNKHTMSCNTPPHEDYAISVGSSAGSASLKGSQKPALEEGWFAKEWHTDIPRKNWNTLERHQRYQTYAKSSDTRKKLFPTSHGNRNRPLLILGASSLLYETWSLKEPSSMIDHQFCTFRVRFWISVWPSQGGCPQVPPSSAKHHAYALGGHLERLVNGMVGSLTTGLGPPSGQGWERRGRKTRIQHLPSLLPQIPQKEDLKITSVKIFHPLLTASILSLNYPMSAITVLRPKCRENTRAPTPAETFLHQYFSWFSCPQK